MTMILQLDSSGQPNKWITWQDAVTYYAKDLVSWSLGDAELVVRGGDNRLTGSQSIIKTSSIIAVKGEAVKRRNRPPSLNNRELFRRDRHMCAYCGGIFSEHKLTKDHVVPKSKGGLDTWENCVACCSRCNQKKDDRLLKECGMELLYVPYVPSRAEYLLLQNRNVLFDQMEFLLAFIPEQSRARQYSADNQNFKFNTLRIHNE
jgi:5-methylcytosine-specific restriction endonuclease McrA